MNILFGTVWIPPLELLSDNHHFIVFQIRFPRALNALFGGGALALSGLLLQTLFINPLAGPFVLGIASGALTGSVLMILLGLGAGMVSLTFGSLTGALLMTFLVLFFSTYLLNRNSILLLGLMSGYFLSALVNLLIVFAPAAKVKDYHLWTLGSFGRCGLEYSVLLSFAVVVILISCCILSKYLNALSMGENYAQTIGINGKKFRFLFLLKASVLTAIVTAFIGPVAFIGLASPHMAKLIMKRSDHRILIPVVFFSGSLLSLFCDFIARVLFPPHDLPVGLVSSIIGGPFVLYLIVKGIKK